MLLRVTLDIISLRCEIMVVGMEVKVVVVREILFHRGQVRSYS